MSVIISLDLRKKVYVLMKTELFPLIHYDNDFLGVISSVWDIYNSKSTGDDRRYGILGDEIDKHYFMNDDWTDDKLFISILHIYDDEKKFLNFIEQLLELYYSRSEEKSYKSYLDQLCKLLETEDIHIDNNKTEDGAIHPILFIGREKHPTIEDRNITFYVCNSKITNKYRFEESDIEIPDDSNCFVLTFNNGWNDFDIQTWYCLYFLDDKSQIHKIGSVKIMSQKDEVTANVLPKQFYSLDEAFCSLGDNIDYYRNFKSLFGDKSRIYLNELRDASYYTYISKMFENHYIFKTSLLRNNSAEQALRLGRYIIYGRKIDEAYQFDYEFYPKYDVERSNPQEIKFDFQYNCEPFQRIIGIIGENGTGKTTLINSLLKDLLDGNKDYFLSLPPLFSNAVLVSYSPFDIFPIEKGNMATSFVSDYVYCGLIKSKELLYSIDEQTKKLKENILTILKRGDIFEKNWYEIIENIVPLDEIKATLPNKDVDYNKLLNICKKMSSGETMFLYSMTAIIANIRNDTLIFFDEPEQHMHPRAITRMMSSIYKLLDEYESYAVITTHSPYVIRELMSTNVYIFKKDANLLDVEKIGIECFGEDVSVLTDIVFDNMNDNKRYEKFIDDIAQKNKYDFNDTVKALTLSSNKLGLNVRILIQSTINKHSQS